ncbi:MAG: SDR family oxidoreductase [Dehalococcoidia bacterium]|nr:MAG: SDR family oxidoreductase [Dehalococcoidia bacterium]
MTHQTIAQLFDLTGKGAIVTGAAMGIGEAIALRLTEAGAGVMIADYNQEAAERTAGQLKAGGNTAEAVRVDVTNRAGVQQAIEATVNAFGSVDILVNNAAVYPFASVLQMSEETWDIVLDTNLKGLFFCSQAAAQEMIKEGHGGKIINITSMEALHPTGVDLPHYGASKGGVLSLTKALALELAPYSILVNAVAPGGIMTPGSAAQAAALQARGEPLEELTENFMARLPLRRMGMPDDIAKVVLFLASAASDYMTGSLLLADGGYLLS